ncbi:hypothetical protein [Aestuariispira insulae]|uniref:hypothetical protein n=1 Tax=Aestuariispira insulae TaxID=1461337 RepID=UPI0015F293BE|nr:hypothetical protein [Aestuariispira insulae]
MTWNPVDLQHLSFSTKENRAFRPSEDRSLKMARVMLYVLLILSTLFYAALFYMLASG